MTNIIHNGANETVTMSQLKMSTASPTPLFRPGASEGEVPILIGGRCIHCGYVFFPAQTYGCERCGQTSEGLETTDLNARGKLIAFAQVHLHAKPVPATPFTVVVVSLDEGPSVRAILDTPLEEGLKAGQCMVGKVMSEEGGAKMRFSAAKEP
jgi:uncharacterized OB-fold protein